MQANPSALKRLIEIKNVDIAKDLVSSTITGIKSADDFHEYSNLQMKLSEEVTAELVKKHGSMPAFPKYRN